MRIISSHSKRLRRVGISLWRGLAACLQAGLRLANTATIATFRPISICGPMRCWRGWLARPFHRSSFGRLLPIVRNQFAASDLVGGDGDQSHPARTVWIADGCGEPPDHVSLRTFRRTGHRLRFGMFTCEKVRRGFSISQDRSTASRLKPRARGTGDCWVDFSPALSLRTEVVSVEMNGRPLPFKMQPNAKTSMYPCAFRFMADRTLWSFA